MGWRTAKVAVSVIDVRDLAAIRLVQRQCVAVKNADWIGSEVTRPGSGAQDAGHARRRRAERAHRAGLVREEGRPNQTDWWWYRQETAVGLMSWDLTRYDAAEPPTSRP